MYRFSSYVVIYSRSYVPTYISDSYMLQDPFMEALGKGQKRNSYQMHAHGQNMSNEGIVGVSFCTELWHQGKQEVRNEATISGTSHVEM